MKKVIIFGILLGLLGVNPCLADEREDLLRELDRKVKERPLYMKRKEVRIDSLKRLLFTELLLEEQYRVNNLIYDEYYTYRYDSAMIYVARNKTIAEKLNIQKYKDETNLHLSVLLSTTGLFREAIENLHNVQRSQIDSSLLDLYYTTCEWAYCCAAEMTVGASYSSLYREKEYLYSDSVFALLKEGSFRYNYFKSKTLMTRGKMEEALQILLATYPSMPVNIRLYAMITNDIATIYNKFGNERSAEKFLILSAISDIECSLKENMAGQTLALYLFNHYPKDLDRAYHYIQCAMEDARFYNNRMRIVQISKKLPLIVQAYQTQSEREKGRLFIALSVVSLLSLLTVVSLFYTYRQMKLSHKKRDETDRLNRQMQLLNVQLQKTNHTKEEYIGMFMDLCSSYIEKLDKYRNMVRLKISAKEVEDLYRMVSSSRIIEAEWNDFFNNFDTTFLKLFPTFVEDFNKLLQPDKGIVLKRNEKLNMNLRIFALIRLGISDSSKIASFLRYSPQTVYNHRTKIRNAARNRNSFEKQLMEIGK
ncbi:MAG: DUF6377 domain-containing protein [Prevotellaceae bacterium]|jgi:DNA-binding CsgD family transcriptional regulator|nr:DUF6377 domain-containing protein [Prevotellaceae bacterium]